MVFFVYFFKNISLKTEDIKMCHAPLDASRRELFIRIFKSVVALSVSRQFNVCVCTGHPIQLYSHSTKEHCGCRTTVVTHLRPQDLAARRRKGVQQLYPRDVASESEEEENCPQYRSIEEFRPKKFIKDCEGSS